MPEGGDRTRQLLWNALLRRPGSMSRRSGPRRYCHAQSFCKRARVCTARKPISLTPKKRKATGNRLSLLQQKVLQPSLRKGHPHSFSRCTQFAPKIVNQLK